MSVVRSVGLGRPEGKYEQTRMFKALQAGQPELRKFVHWPIFEGAGIAARPLYVPPEVMVCWSPQDQQDKYTEAVLALSTQAISQALERGRIKPEEVSLVVFCSCTGVPLVPSFPSTLAGMMGMRSDGVFRPLHGIGCQGSGPALRDAWEHLRLYPAEKSLVVACEISCGSYHPKLCVDGEPDPGLILGEAIFGDGAGCVLLTGGGPGLWLQDFDQETDFSQSDKIGMVWTEGRYRLLLCNDAADRVVPLAKKVVSRLLRKAGWASSQVRYFIVHSGGASIIRRLQQEMGLSDEQVRFSWETWRDVGNLSSATVLFALERLFSQGEMSEGDKVVIVTLGAGIEAVAALGIWVKEKGGL